MKTLFEQQLHNEMKNSLYVEFKYCRKPSHDFFTESRGSMNDVRHYIDIIRDEFWKQTARGKINTVVQIPTECFKNIPNKFANNIKVTIDFVDDSQNNLHGNYVAKVNNWDGKQLKLLEINFTAHGSFWDVLQGLPPLIAHELLHAYEDYMRYKKTNKGILDAAADLHYDSNQEAKNINSNVIKTLAHIYYMCTSFERNAYIAQLNQQVTDTDKIAGSKQAFEALENTNIYKSYIQIGSQIEFFRQNLSQYKTDIEDWYYLTFKKKDLSPSQIMRRLYNLYMKTWRKIRKTTASYMRNLYESNNKLLVLHDDFSFLLKKD